MVLIDRIKLRIAVKIVISHGYNVEELIRRMEEYYPNRQFVLCEGRDKMILNSSKSFILSQYNGYEGELAIYHTDNCKPTRVRIPLVLFDTHSQRFLGFITSSYLLMCDPEFRKEFIAVLKQTLKDTQNA